MDQCKKGWLDLVGGLSGRVRKQDGFTLIELIVVVAILGILAAVVTPRVLDALDNAKVSGAEAYGKQVQLAMERYYVDNGRYPDPDGNGTANVTTGNDAIADLEETIGKYLTINADNISWARFEYIPAVTGTNPTPEGYELILELTDSKKEVRITATSLGVKDNAVAGAVETTW